MLITDTKEFINPPLIQFGPPRTGSTLLWNILRTAYPNREVLKLHKLNHYQKSALCESCIVATIRNPLDFISSSIQRYEKEPTIRVIEQQLDEYERLGIWDLLELENNPRAIVLKYEDFIFDWDHAYRKIEDFLGEGISDESKKACLEKYSIEAVEKKAVSLGSFSNYDREDHIHGKHISKFRGKIGYYSEYLNEDMINKIYNRFTVIFSEFGYETTRRN